MRISRFTAFLMVSISVFFDIIEFILALLAVGLILNTIIGIIKWFLFWLWFTLRGVKFFGNTKRLKIGAGAFILGLIPVINALPEFTVGIILTIRDVRKEDRVKLASVEQ